MKNKIFFKISGVIFAIVIIYASFITFIVNPIISQYLIDLEEKQAKTQLKRVEALIKLKENHLHNSNIFFDLEKEKENFLQELNNIIQSITVEDLGYVFIINNGGKMILHPDSDIVNKEKDFLKKVSRQQELFKNLKFAYENNKLFKYKWNRLEDPENFNYEKIAWLKYNDFFGWYIASAVYVDDLESKSKQLNGLILKLSLGIFLLVSLLAIVYLKRLLKPISELTKNARLVESGNLEVRNKIYDNDELGILAEHFNSMLDFIEDNTNNLENKVKERTSELQYKLYHDNLTGLKNRLALLKEMKKHEFSALNLINIDDFDSINELYGIEVGDEVLIEISKLLAVFAIKNNYSLYRIGSDTFALLDTQIKDFLVYDKKIENIRDEFKKEIFIRSLGLETIFDVTVGTSISQIKQLACANIALKSAKKIGKKFAIYNETIDTKENITQTAHWKEEIKTALDDNRVIPFFQAIYNNKNELIKYELLMRIEKKVNEESYYISPIKFLSIAVKIKQYFSLNKIVIKSALENIEKIGKDISINLSFNDIMNIEYMQFLEDEIDKLDEKQRSKIVFEILESDDITDYDVLNSFTKEYRKKGIRIAIDDFGTGFSNFSYILKIKPDYIKIDGSLIKDINENESSFELVKSIVKFSKSLEIKTIAEYVHSKEVYEIVKELGVDEFQGYFLSEPKRLI